MTREQAIEVLNMVEAHGQIVIEAKEMAIEALKIEPREDCISKQAVLDQTYLWSRDEFLRVTNPFDYLRKRINSLPSVTPAGKVGRLVDTGDGHSVECSECGKWFFHGYLAKIEIKYCPTCGAKMQEVEE